MVFGHRPSVTPFRYMPDRPSPQPILFVDVDVDGVISLFGFPPYARPPGRFQLVDGIAHCLGHEAGARLGRLAERFELMSATGWEEKANEYLPRLLGLSAPVLPVLSFDGRAVWGTAHWKLAAIEEYVGDRPAAWIDDSLDEACERWARDRRAPTLLVRTQPATGVEEEHVEPAARVVRGARRPPHRARALSWGRAGRVGPPGRGRVAALARLA
jgi:hypothetical protein